MVDQPGTDQVPTRVFYRVVPANRFVESRPIISTQTCSVEANPANIPASQKATLYSVSSLDYEYRIVKNQNKPYPQGIISVSAPARSRPLLWSSELIASTAGE